MTMGRIIAFVQTRLCARNWITRIMTNRTIARQATSAIKMHQRLFTGKLAFWGLLFWAWPAAWGQMTVTLTPSAPSPQPVGTSITWTAIAANANASMTTYRFEQSFASGSFNVIRDYSLTQTIAWAGLQEGSYQVRVKAYDASTSLSAIATVTFQYSSRVTGNTPVVSPTAHPLVALYSAPPC